MGEDGISKDWLPYLEGVVKERIGGQGSGPRLLDRTSRAKATTRAPEACGSAGAGAGTGAGAGAGACTLCLHLLASAHTPAHLYASVCIRAYACVAIA